MNSDPLSELKTRLRQDAQKLSKTRNRSAPVAALLERHSDRRRRRKLLRSVGLILVAVVLPGGWVASHVLMKPPDGIASNNKSMPSAAGEQRVVERAPFDPSPTKPGSMVDQGTMHAGAGFVPIVLVRTNTNGEQMLVAGLYIPERSESIALSRLSQAQQRAVRMVLGLKKKSETRMPI